MAQEENKIQNATLKFLLSEGVFAWRQGNHSIFDPKLNGYRTHNGLKGVPDILSVIKGQLVGWEIKTKTGRQSSDQKLFEKRLIRHGGRYFLIRSIDDVKKFYSSF